MYPQIIFFFIHNLTNNIMRKLLFFLCALLTGVSTVWAEVTMPTPTADAENPTYYTIKNYRSGKYVQFTSAGNGLSQSADVTVNNLWYFETNGNGVNIVPALNPELKVASTTSLTAEGTVFYLVENPYKEGYFCISTNQGLGGTSCWDSNANGGFSAGWTPAAGDADGTSWSIERVEGSELQTILTNWKNTLNERLSSLSTLSVYSEGVAAVDAATNLKGLKEALTKFNVAIALKCRSNKYLKIGYSACSYVASATDYDNVIELESAGDGSFYLKGFKSGTYIGDVQTSTAIETTAEPEVAFYIQSYNEYTVVRPTQYTDGSQRYIHNGGSGCVGWGTNADNTQHTLEEVTLPPFVEVTYNIYHEGSLLVSAVQKQFVSATAVVPEQYYNEDYVEYVYSPATISSETKEVRVDATYKDKELPFELSENYDNATWYYLHGHSAYDDTYISTNGTATVYATGNGKTKSYLWAFTGNLIQGIKLINMASGEGKELQGTNPATMGTNGKAWILKEQKNNAKNRPNPFGLYDYQQGNLNTQNGTLKYWGDFDGGSTFWVEDPADSYADLIDEWKQLAASKNEKIGYAIGQYHLSGVYEGKSMDEVILELENSGYSIENFIKGWNMFESLEINQPNGKLVRFYCPGTERYIGALATDGSQTEMVTEENEAGIYYVTNNNKLWSYDDGRFCIDGSSGNGVKAADYGNAGGNFGFDDAQGYSHEGKYNMWNNGNHYGFLISWTSGKTDRNGQLNNDDVRMRGAWEIQEVTEVAVTITDAGYATLFSPVALTVPSEVKAYTGEVNGSYLTLTEVPGGVIPAETAVVLAGEAGSYTFEVAASEAAISGNALQGALAGLNNAANTILTLQHPVDAEEVGFYTYTGSTLAGTKAYLPAEAVANIKGLTFSFGTTDGIATVEGATKEDAAIYNIAGQRVEKAVKGVYIINGKKVLVK